MGVQAIQTHNYEREEQLWITGNKAADYAQIKIPVIGEMELYLRMSQMMIQNPEGTELLCNGKPVVKEQITIRRGDTLTTGGTSITFFDTWIEITSDCGDMEVLLPKTAGEREPFAGFPRYKRSPRVVYPLKEEKIEIKAPPQKKTLTKGGIMQMIIPTLSTLSFTVLMGVLLKRGPYVYMSIGMTIITTIFSVKKFVTEKKEIKSSNEKREKIYTEYLLETRKRIKRERKKEAEAMNYQYPNAQTLERMIKLHSSRLYERTRMDDDFLQVILGYYRGESDITVTYCREELEVEKDELKDLGKVIPQEYGKIENHPLTIELKKAHLGLVGSKRNIHEQLKNLLFQLTFFQSYHDLQIVFVHHEAYREEFAYTRWYPHLHIQAINVTGDICTEQSRDQIFGSIQQILKERKQKQEEEQQQVVFTPHLLFIIDEPGLILNHPVMEYLQSKELDLGFSFIYTADQQQNLPENIKTICILENAKDGCLLLNEGTRVNRTFRIQQMEGIQLESAARMLSALIHEQGMSSQIPEAISFFEMYNIEHPEDLNVKERWRRNQSHKSLSVPLGVRAKEDYVELNLHEKAHGPHGLVAGTTGSGKSEIVQSYILSLAVNFHPHEVGFLLIDYKGGGMANLFADLPHLLGTITNLDKAESMRAMASIKSELARRQKIFGENGVNHINGYNKLFKLGKVEEPLPHLFLISDEFAELKKEQPEFMSELISAARIGRSLGIHLILATQKPSGVVDDQIWTNSKFKLCLKVQNAGDSKEMLKTPDAADITQAGRAYLQVGNNEIYELFQSAWSGASYQKDQSEKEEEDDRVYLLNDLGQGVLMNQDLSGPAESNQIKATQLDVIVSHLKSVYEKEQTAEVKRPWQPPLPTMLVSPYTQKVFDSALHADLDTTLGLGIVDIPEEQVQREYVLDLGKKGHLLYMASSGYGKSMILGHIIIGLSMKNAVKNLNVYILDLGNSALIPYKGLPHVADYMGFDDTEKIEKFQKLILDMIAERKKRLARAMAQNFSVYNQSQPDKLKGIVIAVDNYDVVNELGDNMVSFLQKVARDGAGLGIYLVMTMTRENVMRAATKGNFKERIAGFNFADGEINGFIGRSQLNIPENKKGRALVKQDSIHMMQLYSPAQCEDELVFNERIQSLIKAVSAASSEEKAKGIPTLPDSLYYEMLSEYPGYKQMLTLLPLGIDVEELQVKYLDVTESPGVIVGGSGMGRTNALRNILTHIKGNQTYLFDAANGHLRRYQQEEWIAYAGDKNAAKEVLQQIKEEIEKRQERYRVASRETPSLIRKEFCQTLQPLFIVIDVLQELYELLDSSDEQLDILAEAAENGIYIVVTSDIKLRPRNSKFLNIIADSKRGLVLGNIREQNVFSYTGIREENRKAELGYYHVRGENYKLKLIEHMEGLEGAEQDEQQRL